MRPLLALCLTLGTAFAGNVGAEAHSVKRSELPDDFPPQVFSEGFAIIQVRLTNHAQEPWEFDPREFQVSSPKGKQIKRAETTDLAPELVNYFRGGRRLYGADVRRGPRVQTTRMGPHHTNRGGPGTLDADAGKRIREYLESHELQEGVLAPGESVEGYIYLKSKKSGGHLSGGSVEFPDSGQVEIQ